MVFLQTLGYYAGSDLRGIGFESKALRVGCLRSVQIVQNGGLDLFIVLSLLRVQVMVGRLGQVH